MTRLRTLGWIGVLTLAIAECGMPEPMPTRRPETQTTSPATVPAAHLAALSEYSASLGMPITGYGSGFPATPDDGHVQLVFNGDFQRDDGRSTPVHTAVEARVLLGNELVWDQLGPYGHPFTTRGDELGTFHGTVGARWIRANNDPVQDPSPIAITFTIQPSIVVRAFGPVTAQCQGPVKRAFGVLPYDLQIETIGFTPRSITYVVSAQDAGFPDTMLTHSPITGSTDHVSLVLPPVPASVPAYTLAVRILAADDTHRVIQTTFAVGVHDPVDVVYSDRAEIAEIYAPEIVSGCMNGGLSGRTVTYSESMSQTLMRSKTLAWNRSWIDSHGVSSSATESMAEGFMATTGQSVSDTHSDSMTNGYKLSNGFSLASKDGISGTWKINEAMGQDEVNGTNQSDQMSKSMGVNGTGQSGPILGPGFAAERNAEGTLIHHAAGTWKTSLYPQPNFFEMSIMGSAQAKGHTDTSSHTVARAQTVGAGASTSKKIYQNASLNGSETTTDLQSFTSSQSQTQSVRTMQAMSEGTADRTQASTGMGTLDTDTVRSSEAVDRSFKGVILAGQFGVFYRQTTRLAIQGSIVAYDQCGNGEVVGKVSYITYAWAPDLAQGPHCKPLPPSSLPPYQCLLSPCTRVPPQG